MCFCVHLYVCMFVLQHENSMKVVKGSAAISNIFQSMHERMAVALDPNSKLNDSIIFHWARCTQLVTPNRYVVGARSQPLLTCPVIVKQTIFGSDKALWCGFRKTNMHMGQIFKNTINNRTSRLTTIFFMQIILRMRLSPWKKMGPFWIKVDFYEVLHCEQLHQPIMRVERKALHACVPQERHHQCPTSLSSVSLSTKKKKGKIGNIHLYPAFQAEGKPLLSTCHHFSKT